jgi:putative acetyltransferase
MNVSFESAKQPEIVALITLLDEYQVPLYPAESHHGIDIDALCQPNVLFAVARDEAGKALACGALVLGSGYGELKRMYTLPEQRGKGLARRVLTLLEEEGRRRGCERFMLETGYLQSEAITFYERSGYRRSGPFGDYQEDPNSIFMQK